jgi:hypothetical protein
MPALCISTSDPNRSRGSVRRLYRCVRYAHHKGKFYARVENLLDRVLPDPGLGLAGPHVAAHTKPGFSPQMLGRGATHRDKNLTQSRSTRRDIWRQPPYAVGGRKAGASLVLFLSGGSERAPPVSAGNASHQKVDGGVKIAVGQPTRLCRIDRIASGGRGGCGTIDSLWCWWPHGNRGSVLKCAWCGSRREQRRNHGFYTPAGVIL